MSVDPTIPVDRTMFVDPSSWCDRRCEICPLAPSCPVATIEAAREAAFPGRDTMEWVAEDLATAMAMVVKLAEEQGIDLEGPVPEPAAQVQALGKLATSYSGVLLRTVRKAPLHCDDAHVRDLMHFGLLVAMKCNAVASFLEPMGLDDDVDTFEALCVPQLLLIELIAEKIRESMHVVFEPELRESFDALHEELDRHLRPLYVLIPDEARTELQRRIEAGDVPSPFLCTAAPLD